MLEHGGKLRAAASRYGIPVGDWLDLSTGINPTGYAPPAIPPDAWQRLPEDEDGLIEAATRYYGTADLLPIAGSQAAIQCLPQLRKPCRVGVLSPGYAEHAHAWKQAGHEVDPLPAERIDAHVNTLDVLVLMNPNNPTGATFAPEQLHDWHNRLAERGGWLIVDEAFADATPTLSVIRDRMPPGLTVLRSLGKFFGLAGARVGFVAAHAAILEVLRERLGPWTLTGPSRIVAQAALSDAAWQQATRARLIQEGARLAQMLEANGLVSSGGCALFQWVQCDDASALHEKLAQRGILTRLFAKPASLRFGLPRDGAGWQRLAAVLNEVRK